VPGKTEDRRRRIKGSKKGKGKGKKESDNQDVDVRRIGYQGGGQNNEYRITNVEVKRKKIKMTESSR
jgi:hypothetical protein